MSKAKVDIKVKVDARARIAKAEARAPRACLRAKDHAKVSKAGSLRLRLCSPAVTGADSWLFLCSVHKCS